MSQTSQETRFWGVSKERETPIARLRLWRKRRRILADFRMLRGMPEYRLRDLGITHEDVEWAEGRAKLWLDLDLRP